ncbi:MAG: hypothetical protein ACI97A_004080 [Planctomycetota bacterium]|jgi:hypothetical protein
MSDQTDNEVEMPEPTPVFDVTYSHIYAGQVYNQFYFFLWISLAFFVGAILPWNGKFGAEGFTIWQGIMMVCSAGTFWACIANIKSRRLTFWPVLSLEILAVLFVLTHFRDVQATSAELQVRHQAEIQAEIDDMPELSGKALGTYQGMLQDRLRVVPEVFPLTMGKVFGAPFKGMILGNDMDNKKGEKPTRFMATTAWNSYGMGFHMTWLSMLTLTVFMLFSFVTAFKNAKPKEDPKEARRRAREAREAGSDEGDTNEDILGQQTETVS